MKRSTMLKLIQLIFASQSSDPICGRLEAEILNECEPDPKSGTGVCICRWSPEKMREHSACLNEAFELNRGVMTLDHRCPHHGEKAQPKLWGRYKILELDVTPAQWISFGVENKECAP